MAYLSRVVLLLLVLAFLNSCSLISGCKDSLGFKFSSEFVVSNIDSIDHAIEEISREIYPTYGGGNVVITDFVESSSYKASSSGVFMGELLRNFISRNTTAKVLQLDIGKSFTLSSNGLTLLTRHAENVLQQKNISLIGLIGSYHIQNNALYIFVKRINIRTGKVIMSSSRKIPYSCIGSTIYSKFK